ncbi:uncharacterized protein F4822DRAFT_433180 [Hypoxylon trugodes]|uniref:uncharacterized protein n=1 Tax=Hypoxylon trugodes TaxID=326681 RepID=UPI002197B642|nr:uncharacterized protein F4822DRAFT_433180 [Hypoxylon trugodes]KAI1384639.1 hypothetical protein F4822DRAFT_433180 [Hypoxylon trugodes]
MASSRSQSRRRLLDFLLLLAVASTSSALNLSQFQVITSSQIPKRCIRAYQTEIAGCTRNDFTNGRQCSSSCVKGLQATTDLIGDACGDLNVTPNSLLGIVLLGNLVEVLCPGYQTTTVTKTVKPSLTSGFSTIVPAPTITSVDTNTNANTKTTKTSQKATQTNEASTTVQQTSQETQPAPTTSANQDTSSPSNTDATQTQDTAQSSATNQPAQSSSSSDDDSDTPTPFIGGSPFDPAPIQSSGNTLHLGFCIETFMATIFSAILLLR